MSSAGRREDDHCPGVLRPHLAEDGALIRLRFPGGRTTGATLRALGRLAGRHGNPDLQLTSRGSLQLRGLPPVLPEDLVSTVAALGVLPSPAHERVRNIAASPLTGIAAGLADVSGLVAELDHRLLAEPALAGLPGRFLFVLDDGRGDVSRLAFDLGYRATSAESGLIMVGDPCLGLPVAAERAAAALVELARDFLTVRRGAWHVAERPGWAAARRTGATPAPPLGEPSVPLGAVGGAASVHVPLALLTPPQIHAVATAAGDRTVVVTPWRGLVLPGAAGDLPDLVATGLVADAASPWPLVSACVGAPGCARTSADTRSRARDLVAAGVAERTHVSGCPRRCGAPTGPYQDLVLDARPLQLAVR